MVEIDKPNRTIIAQGLCIKWVYASSVPGPDCKGGMATCDSTIWVRINGGAWYRPQSGYRSLLRVFDLCTSAETPEELIEGLQGRKQFT